MMTERNVSMIDTTIALWAVSGMLAWVFLGIYWGPLWHGNRDGAGLNTFGDWTFWLLIVCCCAAGPFTWIIPLIQRRT